MWVPRIENPVPGIIENYHRVPRIREIGSLHVHTRYLTFSLIKIPALDCNFWTRNPSRSSRVSKDSDCSLVSNTSFGKHYHLMVWAQCQVKWARVTWITSTYDVTHKKMCNPNQKLFFIANYKTCQVFWAFEEHSTAFGARVTLTQSQVRSGCFGVKSWPNVKMLTVLCQTQNSSAGVWQCVIKNYHAEV